MIRKNRRKKNKLKIAVKSTDRSLLSFRDIVESMFDNDPGVYQNVEDLAHFVISNQFNEILSIYLHGGKGTVISIVKDKEEYEKIEFRKFNGKLEFTIGN